MITAFYALLMSLSAQAYTINIQHTGPVEFENITFASTNNNQVTSGRLKNDTEITFANQNTLQLNQGTKVGFYPSNQEESVVKIYDLIITDSISRVIWSFTEDLSLAIDCSKARGSGASFVFFTPEGHLEEGCSLTNRTVFDVGSDQQIILEPLSKFKITPTGRLTYGQKVEEGKIKINNKEVLLSPGLSVAFYDNGTPYFIHLKQGESFNAPTVYGDMLFGQNTDEDHLFPTTFYEDGKIESGWHVGQRVEFSFEVFERTAQLPLESQAPVRLNNEGSIHQIALTRNITLVSASRVEVVRREIQYGLVQSLNLEPGDEFVLPSGAQLILEDNQLTGFTHQEGSGLSFVYSFQDGEQQEQLSQAY